MPVLLWVGLSSVQFIVFRIGIMLLLLFSYCCWGISTTLASSTDLASFCPEILRIFLYFSFLRFFASIWLSLAYYQHGWGVPAWVYLCISLTSATIYSACYVLIVFALTGYLFSIFSFPDNRSHRQRDAQFGLLKMWWPIILARVTYLATWPLVCRFMSVYICMHIHLFIMVWLLFTALFIVYLLTKSTITIEVLFDRFLDFTVAFCILHILLLK